jgi:hypothetical protein
MTDWLYIGIWVLVVFAIWGGVRVSRKNRED